MHPQQARLTLITTALAIMATWAAFGGITASDSLIGPLYLHLFANKGVALPAFTQMASGLSNYHFPLVLALSGSIILLVVALKARETAVLHLAQLLYLLMWFSVMSFYMVAHVLPFTVLLK